LIKGETQDLQIEATYDMVILDGPLWDGTPGVNINASSYLQSVRQSYKRDELDGSLQIDVESVFGDMLEVSYQNLHSHESIIGIERLSEIPVMHVYFEGDDDYSNDYIKYSYWSLGS
jgi:hypothetical protein